MVSIPLTQEPRQRVRLLVAYDGSAFHGFARNVGVTTVAGTLEEHLSKICREPITVTGAGRTDRGVHAWGQVVTFDMDAHRLDPPRLQRSLNSLCPEALSVREVTAAPSNFDARYSAQWRRYRYSVLNTVAPNPFETATTWHVDEPIDLAAMRTGCAPLMGLHDFTSFCRRPPPFRGSDVGPTMMRRVLDADWLDVGDGVLQFEITASAFCHQMVRSIVGTLVDVGRRRRKAVEVAEALHARDRSMISNIAPAHGLCLWEVGYR